MSRVGQKPIPILDGVKVSIQDRKVVVEGPKGKLDIEHRPEVSVVIDEEKKEVNVTRQDDERESRAYHGLTRSLINNMVFGVKNGYDKRLEIVGVGYQGAVQGQELQLRVGYANEIKMPIPAGLSVSCPDQQHVLVEGYDKQQVFDFAAQVRAVRKPEPYKGKGIRYQGEQVKIKPGKAAT